MPVKTPPKKQVNAKPQAAAAPDQLHTKSAITTLAQNNNGLPAGWRWVKLGEVCRIAYGKGLPTKQLKEKGFPVFGANGIIGFNDKYLYEESEVLISCRGAYSGKINLSPPKCYVTNNSLILEINDKKMLNKHFLFHMLHSVNKTKLVTGTAQPQVTINNAVELLFPLPPFTEQHAIVSKIEELLSELDKGKQQLETAQQQLKIYRQAVLKWAFEGEFTEKLRTSQSELDLENEINEIIELRKKMWEDDAINFLTQKGKFLEGQKLKLKYSLPEDPIIGLTSIPKNWKVLSIDDISWRVTYGITVRPEYIQEGIPLISAKELKNNLINIADASKISQSDYDALSMKCRIFENDVLFSKTGTIGRAAIFNFKSRAASSQNVAVISPVINPHFLKYYLTTPLIQKLAKSKVKAVGVGDLQLGILRRFPIPVPTKKEQELIVQEIESRLSVCDKVEETITTSLAQADTLRQSILKKAFEGKLVKSESIAIV